MKLIWISDPHLEFLAAKGVERFLTSLRGKGDALLITGDISNARRGSEHWQALVSLEMPIYFILGNHDYYFGSISQVRDATSIRGALYHHLHWMSGKAIKLSPSTWLVGSDGWGDGRVGAGAQSTIRLNDSNYIADLRDLNGPLLFAKLNSLGDESCRLLKQALNETLEHKPSTILVATHVPPFPEASLYRNKPSDRGYARHFVNLGLGDLLLQVAGSHPAVDIKVYCGHTHHRATFKPLPNLTVEVAGADYVAEVAQILEV